MKPAIGLLALGAILLAGTLVGGSSAAFTAMSSNSSSSFATASDWVSPAVTLTSPAEDAHTSATPTFSGAAGTASGDSATVTVTIFSGAEAAGTPAQTRTATRSVSTWTTTASTLPAGTYTVQVTQTDSQGNTGTVTRTFTVDEAKPEPSAISAVNGGSGSAGRLNAGDKITFTFSKPIAPTSVLSSFTGSSASVTVRFYDEAEDNPYDYGDSLTVLDGSRQANVELDAGSFWGIDGGVFTGRNYVTGTVNFAATMTRSSDGTSFVITLGSPDRSSRLVTTTQAAANMIWLPRSGPTDTAGNGLGDLGWVYETDNDRDF